MEKASQHVTVKRTSAMFDLGIFFYFCFLLIGGFCHFFQVRILNTVHELDMLLQHQPFRKGAPGVWAVPVEQRQGGNLSAGEEPTLKSPLIAERAPPANRTLRGVPMSHMNTSSPKSNSDVARYRFPICEKNFLQFL